MLDPNNGYDFRKALDVGSAVDDLGFYWYEDPDSAARVRQHRGAQQAADHAAVHERQAREPVPDRLPLHKAQRRPAGARDCAQAGHHRTEEAVFHGRGVRRQLRDRHGRQLAAQHSQPARDLLGAELRVLRVLDAGPRPTSSAWSRTSSSTSRASWRLRQSRGWASISTGTG